MAERSPGKNFTDRQRIKRKAERWASKFRGLPLHERTAILEELAMVGEFSTRYSYDPNQLKLTMVCACGHSLDLHDDQGHCGGTDPVWAVGAPHDTKPALAWCHCNRNKFLSPMPDSGVTKLSPRESAERGGDDAR